MGGVWSAGWISIQPADQTPPLQSDKYQCRKQFSPDYGHMDGRNMYRREINKYIKRNCAPSWIYLLRLYSDTRSNKYKIRHIHYYPIFCGKCVLLPLA